jgi:hypothetical protein
MEIHGNMVRKGMRGRRIDREMCEKTYLELGPGITQQVTQAGTQHTAAKSLQMRGDQRSNLGAKPNMHQQPRHNHSSSYFDART